MRGHDRPGGTGASAWSGHWIWAAPGPPESPVTHAGPTVPDRAHWNRLVHLRRIVSLDTVPAAAPARVTADSRYVLWVNGVEVSRGPVRNIPERLAYHEVDLAPHLRRGANVVAALVRFYGTPGRWWRPAQVFGQLGLGSFLFDAPAIDVRSDASWRGRPAPWLQHPPGWDPTREVVDGRDLPWGWLDARFDDGSWPPAVELRIPDFVGLSSSPPGPPFSGLEPSGVAEQTAIPRPGRVVGEGFVARTEDDADPSLAYVPVGDGAGPSFTTFDVGAITHGTVVATVSAVAGTVVDLFVGEDLSDDGLAVIAPRRWNARFTAGGTGEERFETFDPIGFRYLTVVVRGAGDVVSAGAVERRYPTAGAASFACDDTRLERIWRMAARTVEVCALDAFVDCPGREQHAWVGDAYVHTVVALVANADWRLVRRNLRIGAHAQRRDGFLSAMTAGAGTLSPFNIPEYSLHWVRALSRYVERSGDVTTARELLPTATEVIAAFERHRSEDGFLRRLPGVVFVDWAQTERADVTGAVDALFAAALLDHARMVELVLGDDVGAAQARAAHAATAAAFERLWDEERGVYVDALDEVNGPRRRVSQQTNALAIVGRCGPEHRWPRMLQAVLDPDRVKLTLSNGDLPDHLHWSYQRWEPESFDAEHDVVMAQPFLAHFLHQAVAAAGRHDELAALCLRWWDQIERGNTTFEEFWKAPPGTTSRCHGWAATPAFDLTTHVLGVRQVIETAADLGFRRAVVAPQLGTLRRLAATVPTPHGDLVLDLRPDGGAVNVPAGMVEVVVELPGGPQVVCGPGRHELGRA